ncbi:MAG: hypothetical protein JXM70_09475 [Pirellulales bacterium]|nr:hypothetical protein [Pirellulales bacterium]
MRIHSLFFLVLLLLVELFSLAGCGSNSRHALHGTVTLDGQAVKTGTISFLPSAGTSGNSSGSEIKDGKYSIPAEMGLQPGKYRVTINARIATGRQIRDPQIGKLFDEMRPASYKQMGKLTVTIPAEGNEASFELTMK